MLMPTPAVPRFTRLLSIAFVTAALVLLRAPVAVVHGQAPTGAPPLYQQLKTFTLTGGSADVASLVLKRDRVEMTFTGTFYFSPAVEGHVTGAVFVGQGTVHAAVPTSAGDFEKDSVKRLLGADVLESDFKTTVLRMTDDTFDAIASARSAAGAGAPVRTLGATASADAQRLATDFEPRLTMESGINLSARLATSIMNAEAPGMFFAEFDGGKRGRFEFVLDHQNRIPSANFGINGGEKGLFFTYQPTINFTEVWMAFYALQDYERNQAVYSDVNNLIDITHYQVDVDVRNPASHLGLAAHIEMKGLAPNLRAIPFRVGESLGTRQETRLKRQMRLKGARVGGQSVPAVQEDWEGGFTVFLPAALKAGDTLTLDVDLDGNFMEGNHLPECFYLLDNVEWLPRHGELDRATFDLTFRSQKRHVIAAVGTRLSEQPDETQKDIVVTKYKIEQPVSLVAFAVGAFTRTKHMSTSALGGQAIPLEFNGVSDSIAGPNGVTSVNSDFMLDELDNAIRYFSGMFGKYPYPSFGAVLHPYPFGQGFPTMLFLFPTDSADIHNHEFIAHETAHQWWGNIVAWRSYRDQWLSEGFAEYSAMLYTVKRTAKEAGLPASELFREAREELRAPPRTATGITKGRLADIGPIILGRRLNTTKSFGAYQALIYKKGALVLRMLHYLMSNPTADPMTGGDAPFYAMMSDFVERHRNGTASTEEFFQVAGEHFARTPIAQKFGLTDLKWFQIEWVYQTGLPSYTLDYEVKPQADKWVISGTIRQENVPDTFSMPLPLVFTFGSQTGRATIRAVGPSTTFEMPLPLKPTKVELDPLSWVLSDKTTTKGK
jgi:hypothetical protein